MIRIDSKAGDAFDRLVMGPLRTIVPLVGAIALVFNLCIPNGSLIKVIDAMFLTAAVTSGPGFALWTLGMAADLVGVVLKFALQTLVLFIAGAIRVTQYTWIAIRDHRGIRLIKKFQTRKAVDVNDPAA